MAAKSYLPDISVIVTCSHHKRWVERCVRSISHQEGMISQLLEILIIDNADDDHSKIMLENLTTLENCRLVSGVDLNTAIRHTLGRYLMLVRADDYLNRNCLQTMKIFLDMNRCYQAVAVDCVTVDNQEKVLERRNGLQEDAVSGLMFRKENLIDCIQSNPRYHLEDAPRLRKDFAARFQIGRLEFPFYKCYASSLS
ncbi:MAG: glycosyltransferase family 2 protein [Nitrospirae bacterium]|nr:glycosyltransferase family 2 protein [Magnetococcales bacterium]